MSEDVFVLVFAARYYKATARFIFRGLCKVYGLRDDVITMIHERYMVLVHLDENARSFIYAALQRAWVQRTLRVPITHQRERDLLIDKLNFRTDATEAATAARHAATAARNVEMASRNVIEARRILILHAQDPRLSARNAQHLLKEQERLTVAEQRAASDAAKATSLAESEEKRAASDAARATEIARIGPMVKIPDWVEAVVLLS